MNTMAIVSELADSGILAVGSTLTEMPHWQPLVDDEDAHVVAFEEDLQECRCCCCTGECRGQSEDEYYDDPLMSGFVEGDYDAEAA